MRAADPRTAPRAALLAVFVALGAGLGADPRIAPSGIPAESDAAVGFPGTIALSLGYSPLNNLVVLELAWAGERGLRVGLGLRGEYVADRKAEGITGYTLERGFLIGLRPVVGFSAEPLRGLVAEIGPAVDVKLVWSRESLVIPEEDYSQTMDRWIPSLMSGLALGLGWYPFRFTGGSADMGISLTGFVPFGLLALDAFSLAAYSWGVDAALSLSVRLRP